MRDKISVERALSLHPRLRDEAIALVSKADLGLPPNMAVRIVQGLRSFEEQASLYAQGRTKPGPRVTNASPGSSFHQYGLAIDFCLVIDKNGDGKWDEMIWDTRLDVDGNRVPEWMEVVALFKAAGWKWGGDFRSIKDHPHLEKTFGYDWQHLLSKYNRKDFIPGTRYVNL